MKNLEGKQIVHALYGRDGRAQFQPGGGGAQNLHGRCKFVGGGALTSSARKWYFQHSQWDISLQKLNLDKVLNKNIFPLEKLPFTPPAPKALPSLHGNGQ